MIIEILDLAERDLIEGFYFYEKQQAGLGLYFLSNLHADIESLQLNAGIHNQPYRKYYRLLAQRFPFAVFYTIKGNRVLIHAVLDSRSDPSRLTERLK